jgi:hypothetical protein
MAFFLLVKFYKLWTKAGDYASLAWIIMSSPTLKPMVNNLHKKAQDFGFNLVPQPSANTFS